MNKPKYSYQLRMIHGKKVLCIADLYDDKNPTPTVTNRAERVLEAISQRIGELPNYIFCQDSYGETDRMVLDNNTGLVRFKPAIPEVEERYTMNQLISQLEKLWSPSANPHILYF